MLNKALLFSIIFIILSVVGVLVMPMADDFSHNVPGGDCVSIVAKILPCSKNGFYFYVLSSLILLLTGFLFLISYFLARLFCVSRKIFEYHSFFYKIKNNRWLALLENGPSTL